jgi:putative oxidoreductase
MIVAYVTADRDALLSIFSSPDKFTAAAPYTFLIASLIVLIFGAGRVSVDAVLAERKASREIRQTANGALNVGNAIH